MRPKAASRVNESEVRADPDDRVDQLDRRLGDTGAAAARARRGTAIASRTAAATATAPPTQSATRSPAYQPSPPTTPPTRIAEPRDSRLGDEGRAGSGLAPAVDDPVHVTDEQEGGSDRERDDEQRHRPVDRVEPEARDESGRAERLAVERARRPAATSPAATGSGQTVAERREERAGRVLRRTSPSAASTSPCPTSPNIIPNIRTNETAAKGVGSTSA